MKQYYKSDYYNASSQHTNKKSLHDYLNNITITFRLGKNENKKALGQ